MIPIRILGGRTGNARERREGFPALPGTFLFSYPVDLVHPVEYKAFFDWIYMIYRMKYLLTLNGGGGTTVRLVRYYEVTIGTIKGLVLDI